ncbi:hypothetical protein [Janthinobacterium sp. GW458P]|uniref:hypothetical protein n=1 Tax=Janthinobacterium sp. GW458P TaxID=1981504 RepID=UPI00111EFC7F|nr:hypothetical protein [Janthinobacterium sp. GW458P]MBE3024250.1 hypothetical protein [Janthinobacterium sp. GW458P]
MSMELIFGAVIAGLVVMFLAGKHFSRKLPKETHFECARCGTVARHNDRTIEAWRNNKTTYFCQPCHLKWLHGRAPREREGGISPAGSRSGSRSGCLGVVVLFAVVPLAGFLVLHAYA